MELNETIMVNVLPEYLEEQSDPEDERFVFSYKVYISNIGKQGATLKTRHWFITNGNGDVQEVKGEGVIGEQPNIAPGQQFDYISGAVLSTPVGSMRGYYVMEADDGTLFHANIPVFTLATTFALN
ncbi:MULTISPECIES: Co2+/Mg2+ efflux protein ApaG [unclassified Oceanobacter]|jgi:ApaG protein|uniref:Co2+/Mg2+ efflux protein ApaG n=1 Tax=unclassified Oceanobacter TaxID=2620260 RepID=UPI0026E1A6AB|nr:MULTISPECIES: Co2+/Mg2+ efflux protein ApaG [unclassified Oceanobacter]MDO6681936.1 Co2+/Mg2+ efflux protein ApaG [Oceanobacter sp. 5_MG-2023]MDP2505298.1 Co2+/Mg2+ efflux protein ApaG [Oceanobacter sp. 3_MG-2023]MDP2547972.1 Co2+/Mg2+ efflux protein ApaG [Oceanobacter sp. 4_MG-2023]MDP2609871.1 Co2+/Mg2+ efflux protein ApaG [Oceanobacter sp. 1_MG-2023]MDP2612251.1 Co2+/Mg2+ efflux protein ApaG [Oceanobacter sp. 2_MG-2023]